MIRVIGDTTSGMTLQQAQELGIEYIPQIIVFGEESYRDDTEIDSQTFVKKLMESKELPRTAAPPPALYTPIYQDMMEKGDSGIVICPSVSLSGTVRSATTALADFPGLDVRIINSGSIGCSITMLLRRAKEMADAGNTLDEIEAEIRKMVDNCKLYAVVDTLEYLHKGGRIGGAAKLLGEVLQIKPILVVKETVEVYEKQRTHKKAVDRLIDIVQEQCKDYQKGNFSFSTLDTNPNNEKLRKEFSERFGANDIPFLNIPPAIMVHAGPGIIICSFFSE